MAPPDGPGRPEPPPGAETARGARFGIRARLLTLLIPGILALLAFDSWNDLKALHTQVQEGYDRAMLYTVHALQRSVGPGQDGAPRLDASAATVLSLFEATRGEHKYLHVGAIAPGGAGPEQLLMGEPDLPGPPAGAAAADAAQPVWYAHVVAALRSELQGPRGGPYTLLVQAAEGTAPRDAAQTAALQQALVRDARMVVLVVALVALGVIWSLRPLRRLRRSVQARRGQAPQPLDASGVPHEVAPLVGAINEQVASYRELLDAQSQFLADASHQLRTPLAIMLTQAAVALREKDPQQMRETLRAMTTQLERSKRLSEQLLSLAHASEQAPAHEEVAAVDLNAIAREVVLQHLTLAHEKGQDLGWMDAREGEPDDTAEPGQDCGRPLVPVRANAPELHEVLANLVHNAIVHTPRGGRITVRVSTAGASAQAEVSDDGPGIEAGRRDEVFGRFRQAGSAAASRNSGSGLGLAIARAYARRNGGDIVLADPDPGTSGLRAILRLPLAS